MPFYWVRMANDPDRRKKHDGVRKAVREANARLVENQTLFSPNEPVAAALIAGDNVDIDRITKELNATVTEFVTAD
jgi:hypothetical protein